MEELWEVEVGRSRKNREKVRKPYKDHKGKWTIGIGHLIGDGSQKAYEKSEFRNKTLNNKEMLDLARKDSDAKIQRVLAQFGKQFFDFYPETQIQIVSSYYRGGLPGSPDTLEHIKDNRLDLASKEFLDNDEYRKSVKEGTGVAPRMRKLSDALAVEGRRVGPPLSAMTFPEAVEKRLKP